MPELQYTGTYHAQCVKWEFYRNESTRTLSLRLLFCVTEYYDPAQHEWIAWDEEGNEVGGFFNLIKKDGQVNEVSVRQLQRGLGWDGNLQSFHDPSKTFSDCQVVVEEDEWEGKVRNRVRWINGYNDNPEAGGNVEPAEVGEYQKRYGSQFRAIIGNEKRAASKPPSRTKPEAEPKAQTATDPETGEEIPF